MCLYLDDDYDELTLLGEGERVARKQHPCEECWRAIEPGERYEYWSGVIDRQAQTWRLCAHCRSTLDLGVRLTGCPRAWHLTTMGDPDPEIGFIANIVEDDGHDLSRRDRLRMLRCYAAYKRSWRWSDGSLMEVPS